MLADLHIHTTASDGQYTPTEVVGLAKDRGLELIAITDHDTADGVKEAAQSGTRLGLHVLQGIELSAKEYDTFHILGYGIAPDAPSLAALCQTMKDGRDDRKYRIIDYLKTFGIELSLSEVEAIAGGKIIGRPHFAQAMTRRGYVASNREAFDRYLDTEEFHAHIERSKPAARDCIEVIHAAGGKVSLAHPYQIGIDDETLDTLVGTLKSYGLDAIECYYPRYTPEQQAFYLHLTEKYHLHITGGSDFHGEKVKPDVQLAAWDLNMDWLLV